MTAADGIGLLVFFVPGVIAFVVDFATGAIYLPAEYPLVVPVAASDLRPVHVDPAELTPERVEAIVQEQTGQAVQLKPGEYRAMRLQTLDEFTPEALTRLKASPHPVTVRFRAGHLRVTGRAARRARPAAGDRTPRTAGGSTGSRAGSRPRSRA